jgi:ATP/maltotriose-dependent transcriptional regulator MalT
MPSDQENITAGQAALRAADWRAARACFEAALSQQDTPEAHDGLGIALWWLNEIKASHDQRTRAYLGFKQRGMLATAAVIAAWLAREQVFLHGNTSAMKGWFARAERLLSQVDHCVEHAWVAVLRASVQAEPAELERATLDALQVARTFDDGALEAFTLAFCGMARVSLGRIEEGMACLDEAMAAATGGEVGNLMIVSEIFCVMLSACESAGDLVRSEHWRQVAAEFAARHNSTFLGAYCRAAHGGLLTAAGRWQDAENELTEAIRAFETGHHALRMHAVFKLAELRIYQGRLEEAEVLLTGYEDYGAAVIPFARLHLAQGDPQLARALLEQALGRLQPPAPGRAPLLLLLVEALLALGEPQAAERAAEEVVALARVAGSDLLLGRAEFARGQVRRYTGSADAAECFQSVMEHLRVYEQSLLVARARLEMAQLLQGHDWAGAVTWARAALASFARLGAAREADEAASLLRRLGVAARTAPRGREPLTQREAEVLALIARGLTNRAIAERLVISAKTVEHHVSQILGKLGLRSRAEAAAFAAAGSNGDRDKTTR